MLLVHHHLKFKLISLTFKKIQCYILYPLGIAYAMGMGMGTNLCPRVLKWVGIEIFYGYGFGKKVVVPSHTLPIAIPTRVLTIGIRGQSFLGGGVDWSIVEVGSGCKIPLRALIWRRRQLAAAGVAAFRCSQRNSLVAWE